MVFHLVTLFDQASLRRHIQEIGVGRFQIKGIISIIIIMILQISVSIIIIESRVSSQGLIQRS